MSYDVLSGKLTNTLLMLGLVLPNVAFDKRWLISEAIEMQREKHQRRENARGLTVDAFHRRIINGYQRCTFDNEITNFSELESKSSRTEVTASFSKHLYHKYT